MSCTIVVGGQYGSEGKGKVVALCSSLKKEPWVIRCGGPNSGHTVTLNGQDVILRQIPTGVINPNSFLLLGAGCAINEDILISEIKKLKLSRERIIVDPRAVLVTAEDCESESLAVERIGSTSSGTGSALMRRMARLTSNILVENSTRLRDYARVESVAPLIHKRLDKNGDVIIEGTQGFGLSLLHSPYYPYVTSRDTTAAGFAMEVGISPRQVDSIVMVLRTFPIRVGGNSGPLSDEISWQEIQSFSGAPEVFPEYTSVTKRLRRVAKFDFELVKMACTYNRPTSIALMGLDRLDYKNYCVKTPSVITNKARKFIKQLEKELKVPVEWIGTGFQTTDVIHLSKD